MLTNHTTVENVSICLRTRDQHMEIYDSFPAWVRKILQDAPYSLTFNIDDIESSTQEELELEMAMILYQGCKESFGPDHPDLDKLWFNIVNLQLR